MINNTLATDLPVIEVPKELRGLSDEEILIASESRQKKFENRHRLSKKERQALKLKRAQEEMQAIAASVLKAEKSEGKKYSSAFDSFVKSVPKMEESKNATKSGALNDGFKDLFSKSFNESTVLAKESLKKADVVVRSSITEAPKPASGRVLSVKLLGGKFAFAQKKVETKVVDAATLQKERAEEREKKIQENLLGKAVKKAPAPVQYDADGNPIKRKRGRPRKNPVIE